MPELEGLLRQNGLMLPAETIGRLEAYQAMLLKWNSRMDLTSVPPEETPVRHFLDALLPLAQTSFFSRHGKMIDVGTGAGFPGMAIAIACPDWQATLLEAQGKRCAFLSAVREALSLGNVRIVQERAEVLGRDAAHREQYDLALARAVAPLNVLAEYLLPFLKTGGTALCWKGPAVGEEWTDGEAAARTLGGELLPSIQIISGDFDAERRIVPIQKTAPTDSKYPRRNGLPAKRPLRASAK